MSKFAKLLSMVLAVAMVLSLAIGAFDYNDIDDCSKVEKEAIANMYDYRIMQGVDTNGTFNPKGTLTRAEMAKIIFVMTKGSGAEASDLYAAFLSDFADGASVAAWAKNYLGYAASEAYIVGDENGNVNATKKVSYIEAAIMILRAAGEEGTYTDNGKTVPEYTGSAWYNNALKDAIAANLFTNLEDKNFKSPMSRADVAVLVDNALNNIGAAFPLVQKSYVVTGVVEDYLTDMDPDPEKEDLYFNIKMADGYIWDGFKKGDLNADEYVGKVVSCELDPTSFEVISGLTVLDCDVYNTIKGKIEIAVDVLKIDGETILDGDFDEDYAFCNEQGYIYNYATNGIDCYDADPVTVYVYSDNAVVFEYAYFWVADYDKTYFYEVYDYTENVWTGEWEYNGYAVPADFADDLVDGKAYVFADIYSTEKDTAILTVSELDQVSILDLSASKKNGNAVITLNGEEVICDMDSAIAQSADTALAKLYDSDYTNDAECLYTFLGGANPAAHTLVMYKNVIVGVIDFAAPATVKTAGNFAKVIDVVETMSKGITVTTVTVADLDGNETVIDLRLDLGDLFTAAQGDYVEIFTGSTDVDLDGDTKADRKNYDFQAITPKLKEIVDNDATAKKFEDEDGTVYNYADYEIKYVCTKNALTFELKDVEFDGNVIMINGAKVAYKSLYVEEFLTNDYTNFNDVIVIVYASDAVAPVL